MTTSCRDSSRDSARHRSNADLATHDAGERETPDLLEGVPADSAFVFTMLETLPSDAWDRLAWDIGPFVSRLAAVANRRLDTSIADPVERLEAALIAELPGPIGRTTRAVLHELHGVAVLRIQVDDAEQLATSVRRAFDRAGASPDSVVAGSSGALAVVRVGRQLAIAYGPADAVRRVMPTLAGNAPLGSPAIDVSSVPPIGGHIDPWALATLLRPVDLGTKCGAAATELIRQLAPDLPRLSIRIPVLTAQRIELDSAENVVTPSPVGPGIPPMFPGRPIVGFSVVAPTRVNESTLTDAWKGLRLLASTCAPSADLERVPAEPAVHGVAIALYGANTDSDSLLPTDIQAYVVMLSESPGALLRHLARAVPGIVDRDLRDDGVLHALPTDDIEPIVRSAHMGRRGDALVLALGETGRIHATTALEATQPPAFLHLFLDVARITAADPSFDEIVVGGDGLTDEADVGRVVARLLDSIDVTVGPGIHVSMSLQPRAPTPAPEAPTPRRIAATDCHRLLNRAWTVAEKALQRLDISEADQFAADYKDSTSFVIACVELDRAQLDCLLEANNPIFAAPACGADRLEFPRLFPALHDPLQSRIHPVDGAIAVSKLAGTWKSEDGTTWRIASSGDATVDTIDPWNEPPEHLRLRVEGRGLLRATYPDGSYSLNGFVLVGDDELHVSQGGSASPLIDEHNFLVEVYFENGSAWIVRDPQGCSLVTEKGHSEPADCTFSDDQDGRWLEVTLRSKTLRFPMIGGHVVSDDLRESFRRVR